MRKSVLAVVGAGIALIILGFVFHRRENTQIPPTEISSATNGSGPSKANLGKSNPGGLKPVVAQNPPANAVVPPSTNGNFMTNWEEKLDAILQDEKTSDADKAKEMIAMFPQLSPEAQEEIAHHISNLTPDENYSLGQFLTNSALPEGVLDVFTEDVLNRPNSVKLPLLLDVAKDPQHPKAGEAKDILELFLEDNYGTDWSKWQDKMNQWLKDNPD